MKTKIDALQELMQELVTRYKQRVPDVARIEEAMINESLIKSESDIENDHVAFRTLGVPNFGIQSLEKIFLYLGYQKRDFYFFPEKKLNAWWYAPPVEGFPRIFLSELRVNDLSEDSQEIIYSYTNKVTADPVDEIDVSDTKALKNYLHSSPWSLPTLGDYESLAAESEYAAWAIYNRYYLNHFTMAVHNLPEGYNTLEAFNEFLERHGIVLNDSGGKIKKSPDGYLLQSSTVAAMTEGNFAGGKKKMIPGSYVEFAERKVLPEFAEMPTNEITAIHRREGFEAANADKIFESTYEAQVSKR